MPDSIAGYETTEVVGETETSVTFRGRHQRIGERFRAVKTVQLGSEAFPRVLLQDTLRKVFVRMCESAALIAQATDAAVGTERAGADRIVFIETVHFDPNADLDSNLPYIRSEWVAGGSLASKLVAGPLAPEITVQVANGILDGLAFLHARNLVHGNLKPGNVLFGTDGLPKLTDGGGNVLDVGMSPRRASLPYLSPEQLEPLSADSPPIEGRADLFTLTLLLYEMLTGLRPGRLLLPDRLPSRMRSGIPPGFDSLVLQGLQPEREQRFQNVDAMRERLSRVFTEAGVIISISKQETEATEGGTTEAGVASLLSPGVSATPPSEAVDAPPAEPIKPARVAGERRRAPRNNTEMGWVPGGTLRMGSEERDAEQPIHDVEVKGFWVARFPVTQALYTEFMNAVNTPGQPPSVKRPGMWKRGSEHAEKPVTGISWAEAVAYARWAGGRLPTEAEWEWAARGPEGRRYPWGEIWESGKANTKEAMLQDVSEVTAYSQGTSWCGATDLLGNVFEWCSSLYQPYPYRAEDGREDANSGAARVLRGGSAISPSEMVYSAFRTAPNASTTLCGFRIVVDEE